MKVLSEEGVWALGITNRVSGQPQTVHKLYRHCRAPKTVRWHALDRSNYVPWSVLVAI